MKVKNFYFLIVNYICSFHWHRLKCFSDLTVEKKNNNKNWKPVENPPGNSLLIAGDQNLAELGRDQSIGH